MAGYKLNGHILQANNHRDQLRPNRDSHRRAYFAIAALAAILWLSSGQNARAQPGGGLDPTPGEPITSAGRSSDWRVRWHSPAGCSSAEEFVDALAEHLPRRPSRPTHEGDIAVAIERTVDRRWRARIRVATPAGVQLGAREFTDRSCPAIVEAAALVVALAVGDATGNPAPQTAGATGPTAAELRALDARRAPPLLPPPARALRRHNAAITPLTARPNTVERRARTGPRLGVGIRVTTGASVGRLPGAAPRLAAAVSGTHKRLRVELFGQLWRRRAVTVNGVPGRAELSLYAIGARGCAERFAIWLCAGGEVERWTGRGVDFVAARSGQQTVSSLVLAAGWRRNLLPELALWLELGTSVPTAVPRFTLGDETLIHQPARISGQVSAGLEIQIR